MIANSNIISLLAVPFMVSCSANNPESKGVSATVLVSRILAERETESAIARCSAVIDYVVNEDRILLPKEKHKERVAVQWAWVQASQVKVDSDIGPNAGRVTANHFDLYAKHKADVEGGLSLDEILSEFADCSNKVESAAGGFGTLLRKAS